MTWTTSGEDICDKHLLNSCLVRDKVIKFFALMDSEDITRWFSNQRSPQSPLVRVFSQYLSAQEAVQILDQFHSKNWIPNGQVLWSGIPRRTAQEWADMHHLQTLTTAMGVLMDESHPACPKWKKSTQQWSKYIHGASAIFAWRIAQGEKVTVLSPPPPERFHPSGLSSFQVIESPIVQGLICQSSVHRVMMAHPTVTESEGFLYEAWPQDRSSLWLARFGPRNIGTKWRNTGRSADKLRLKQLVAVYSEQTLFSTQLVDQLEKKEAHSSELTPTVLLSLAVIIMLFKCTTLVAVGLLSMLAKKVFSQQVVHQNSQYKVMEECREGRDLRQDEDQTVHRHKASGQITEANTDPQQEDSKAGRNLVKAQVKAEKAAAKKLEAERRAQVKARLKARKKHKKEQKAQAKEEAAAARKLKQQQEKHAKVQKMAAQKLEAEKGSEKAIEARKEGKVRIKEWARRKLNEDRAARAAISCGKKLSH